MTLSPVPALEDLDNLLEDLGDLERSLTVKERKAIPLEDFAWPDAPGGKPKYPIDTQEHLDSAATLIGRAPEDAQGKIKARAKSIAKRHGFTLPKSWQDEEDGERSTIPDTSLNSPKEHMDPTTPITDPVERSLPSPDVFYYAPIVERNEERREVVGTATAEVKDAHGTVIGYEASKDAFARWQGNIREMHDPKKAVGRALEITPDDEHKRIIVRVRISKGAQDTWEKIKDGTLTGFSIGGRNGKWTEREIGGEKLPFLERYDASELSLVDNPSCPSSKDVAIVRADGGVIDGVLAQDDELPEIARSDGGDDIARAGATISAATREGMHATRDQIHSAHKQALQNCNCTECQGHLSVLSQIEEAGDGADDSRANIAEIVRSEVAKALGTQLGPVIQRVNALLAHDAGRHETPDFTRNFTAIDTRHEALTAKLNDIAALVQRIADQPASGGPMLRAVDKSIPLSANNSAARPDDAAIIRRATELGMAPPTDPQAAVRAAAAVFQAQQQFSR